MDYSVLIVDDEVDLAESTAEYFNMFDIKTVCVFNADDAIDFFKENTAKLILLDINLEARESDGRNGGSQSGLSGFGLCKLFRKTMDIPILFISARSSDDDMVIALNIGGDDYITKPYSLNVLYSKVKVVLKRYERMSANYNITDSQENEVSKNKALVHHIGNIDIDTDAGLVKKDGKIVELTAIEYKLLTYLLENKNKVVSKQKIFDNVWDDNFVSDGTLNVHVRHLREKLEDDPNSPKFIKTVRGMGLMLSV